MYVDTSLSEKSIVYIFGHFIPEDGETIFLRNIGVYLQIHTILSHRSPTATVHFLPTSITTNFSVNTSETYSSPGTDLKERVMSE
jgi:hypothetical protein